VDGVEEVMAVTLKQLKELLGELPEDVQKDPDYQKDFLRIYGALVEDKKDYGHEWVKEHRRMLLSQWGYVRTLL
jgi:hypothetical protein